MIDMLRDDCSHTSAEMRVENADESLNSQHLGPRDERGKRKRISYWHTHTHAHQMSWHFVTRQSSPLFMTWGFSEEKERLNICTCRMTDFLGKHWEAKKKKKMHQSNHTKCREMMVRSFITWLMLRHEHRQANGWSADRHKMRDECRHSRGWHAETWSHLVHKVQRNDCSQMDVAETWVSSTKCLKC